MRSALLCASIATAALVSGCQEPKKPAFTYPPGTLPVRYESATSHTTCLVASVAMASNYILNDRRFTETSIRAGMREANLDETRIDDVRTYLDSKGLHLLTLAGQIDGKPPTALRYWLLQRGYPVICIINRHGDDPSFNHAVVVTGIDHKDWDPSADKIVYLDPSTPGPLHQDEQSAFDLLWQRGQRAMMIIVVPPADSQAAP